mmetsp:Transcript_87147/g.222001  ORF Transcript_87147/g.222001 Transcript_87147/m.222001 type:complete len:262 (+) Transcript_87147:473-1258(+)
MLHQLRRSPAAQLPLRKKRLTKKVAVSLGRGQKQKPEARRPRSRSRRPRGAPRTERQKAPPRPRPTRRRTAAAKRRMALGRLSDPRSPNLTKGRLQTRTRSVIPKRLARPTGGRQGGPGRAGTIEAEGGRQRPERRAAADGTQGPKSRLTSGESTGRPCSRGPAGTRRAPRTIGPLLRGSAGVNVADRTAGRGPGWTSGPGGTADRGSGSIDRRHQSTVRSKMHGGSGLRPGRLRRTPRRRPTTPQSLNPASNRAPLIAWS